MAKIIGDIELPGYIINREASTKENSIMTNVEGTTSWATPQDVLDSINIIVSKNSQGVARTVYDNNSNIVTGL